MIYFENIVTLYFHRGVTIPIVRVNHVINLKLITNTNVGSSIRYKKVFQRGSLDLLDKLSNRKQLFTYL